MTAVLFDMDGVLLASAPYMKQAFADVLKDIPFDYEATRGTSFPEKIRRINKECNCALDVEEIREKIYEHQFHAMENMLKPEQGVRTFIKQLQAAKIAFRIATSSGRVRAERMLSIAGINAYFQDITAEEDVEKQKPDPALFLAAAKKLGVPPTECVVIEDAAYGIQAAHAAGMKAIGYLGESTEEQVRDADLVIRSFEELTPAIIQNLVHP
ncbi:MAG: HAD family phosphatase [Candidatus Woesearchaeota archaeon]|nr:HAD family phosphatase [Candidatus Woesearchaeota archaeon]